MLILSLLVLQVLPASFCYDLELKGRLNIANNLFGSGALRHPSELVSRLLSYLPSKIVGKGKLPRADTIASPYLATSNNAKNEEKSQLPTKTPLESILEALPSLIENKNKQDTQSENKNQKTDSLQELDSSLPLEQFVNYLKKTGKETIDSVASYIKKELNIKKNITHIVKIISDDYTDMLQNYYDYVKIKENDHDSDLLYLDMIKTSDRLLFNETSKLLNDIVMHEDHNHHAHNGSYKKIKNELLRFSYIYKRETMRYLYHTYHISNEEYPDNSEYGEDIITNLIMLDDKQFLTILQTLAKILKENDNIIARIAEKEDRDLINAKLKDCIETCVETTDLSATKEYFAKIWSVIIHGFQPATSGSEDFKMRINAAKMLVDILDKGLRVEENGKTFDFSDTFTAIRNCRDHKRDDIDRILEELVNTLMKRLEHNLTRNARNEIKALISVVMRGNRGNTADYERLLKFGSEYHKNDDFHPDIDIVI